jgi:hypothetical protein
MFMGVVLRGVPLRLQKVNNTPSIVESGAIRVTTGQKTLEAADRRPYRGGSGRCAQ